MTAATLKGVSGRLFARFRTIVSESNFVYRNPQRCFYLYSPEPFHPIPDKHPKWLSAEEAVQVVTSG